MRGSFARYIPTPMQLLAWGMAAIGVLCLVIVTWFWVSHATPETPGDTHNYILAGLRLDAGHPLYAYGPGDEHVRVFDPESPNYPLYSPPLIGVLFRPIVLLPNNGLYIWWAAMCAMELLAAAMLLRRAPLLVGLALIPLSVPAAVAMEVANADCLVLIGMLVAWRWLVAGHDDRAALLIAFLASLKLTPLFFVWWLLITGRRRAAGAAVAFGAALALVAMLGSEPLVMVKFYQVMTANLNLPTDSSIGPVGLATAVGLPGVVVTWLPRAILVAGIAAMWLTRRRPGLSFAIGAVLMWVASPIASLHTPALVLVAFAPLAWPMARDLARRGTAASPEPATPTPTAAAATS